MEKKFFAENDIQTTISNYRSKLSSTMPENDFEKERNQHIQTMLSDFLLSPDDWDSKTQFSIESISHVLKNEADARDMDDASIDLMFSTCFRFLLDYYINVPGEFSHPFSSVKSFAIHSLNKFSDNAKSQIEYALREMPIRMLKDILYSEDFTVLRSIPSITSRAEELKEKWDKELDARLERIKELEAVLTTRTHEFSFAGLYKGFSNLHSRKKSEHFWSKCLCFSLAALIPVSIVAWFVILNFYEFKFTSSWDLMKSLPALSFILIILYFFRIALKNFNSVKAQLIQIELRMSLCEFIHEYADFSQNLMKEKNQSLKEFEKIIFSNIVVAEEKIPSTFDGVEQIASLLNSLKSSK